MTSVIRVASTLVAIVVVAFAVSLVVVATRTGNAGCASQGGGQSGTEAQLRYVDIGPRQITFTFGPSAVSDSFGVPPYTVERGAASPPPELETGTRRLQLHFSGASGFNPDLTPSYLGKTLLVPQVAGTIREAVITLDTERRLGWDIVYSGSECPTVTTNEYVWGKSPRAQVTITFGQGTWITAEHPATYVGSPILAPVLVAGLGFAPRSAITLTLGGAQVDTTTADDRGRIETGIFVPKLQPGWYELAVSDGAGHRATTMLMVTDEL